MLDNSNLLEKFLLEQEIREINEKIKNLVHEPKSRAELLGFWAGDKAKKHHHYYYPHTSGKILFGSDKDAYWSGCYNNNNSFKTEEYANRAGLKRETEALLWRNSSPFKVGKCNWYFKIDSSGDVVLTYTKSLKLNIPYFNYVDGKYLLDHYLREIIDIYV